jgi:hypothetical protein
VANYSLSDLRVELGPRAVDDPVARELRRRITQNLEHGRGVGAFRRMWGTVVIVAVLPDGRESDTGETGVANQTTLTLRFDWGRLMIHEGRVGRPDVTLWGPVDSILELGDGPALVRRRLGDRFASLLSSRTLSPLWAFTNLLSVPKLRVYGLATEGRLVWRLARLLASDDGALRDA